MDKRKRLWWLILSILILLVLQGCKRNEVDDGLPPGEEIYLEGSASLSEKRQDETDNRKNKTEDAKSEPHTGRVDDNRTDSANSGQDISESDESGSEFPESSRTESYPSNSPEPSNNSLAARPSSSPPSTVNSKPSLAPFPSSEGTSSEEVDGVYVSNEITEPTITVKSVTAKPGEKHVPVVISIKDNPGVASIGVLVSYDSNWLSIDSVKYGGGFPGQTISSQTSSNPFKLIWVNPTNSILTDGTFATLYFDVAADAKKGEYQIALSYDKEDVFDINMNDVDFAVFNGLIQIY